MKKSTIFLLLGLSISFWGKLKAQESDTLQQLEIQAFSLPNTQDSSMLSLDSLRGSKAIALIFCSTHCSFCNNYIDRLNSMAAEFAKQNVHFIAINSDDPGLSEENTFGGMAAARPFNFPYLHDSTQIIARLLEVTINPEALILVPKDSVFRLVYRGKIDNIPLNIPGVEDHRKPFLANALKDVLKAKSPLVPKTALGGCHIQFIDKEEPSKQE